MNMQPIYQKLERELNDDDGWYSENKANTKRICSEYIRNLSETMMTAWTQRIKQICKEYVANITET